MAGDGIPLAAGRLPLAAGRWPLAAGRWPLAAGRCRDRVGMQEGGVASGLVLFRPDATP